MLALVEFLSTFLLGLVSGVSFSHLLQRGPKKTLPAPQFLAIQQVLLRNYGPVIGGLEVAAFFSTSTMAIFAGGEPVVRALASLASACVLVMVLIWAVWINPSTRLSTRGCLNRFRRTGRSSATGGTFFTPSDLCCLWSASARLS
jgi:hypothetical protein